MRKVHLPLMMGLQDFHTMNGLRWNLQLEVLVGKLLGSILLAKGPAGGTQIVNGKLVVNMTAQSCIFSYDR